MSLRSIFRSCQIPGRFLLIGLCWFLLAGSGFCDLLILKSGEYYTGKMLISSGGAVFLEGDDGFYPPSMVAKVCKEENLDKVVQIWAKECEKERLRPKDAVKYAKAWAKRRGGWRAYTCKNYIVLSNSKKKRVTEIMKG